MEKTKLIIHVADSAATEIRWFVLDKNNQIILEPTSQPIILPNNLKNLFEVIVFVPTIDILITTIHLPPTPATVRAQAALAALEDQLAEDIQALHAVTYEDKKTNLTIVAVVKKLLMTNWQEIWRPFIDHPKIVLPDIFLLPWIADTENWQVSLFEDKALVRTSASQGFAASLDNLSALLELHLGSAQNKPQSIIVRDYTQGKVALNELSLPAQIDHHPTDFYRLFTEQTLLIPSLNLTQGEFRTKQDISTLKKVWQWPVIFGVSWLFLWLVYNVSEYIYLDRQNNLLNSQVAALYQQVYPEATAIISPQLRIEKELKDLNYGNPNNEFLGLLASTGKALQQSPKIKLLGLSYRDGLLTIDVSTDDFKLLENFSKLLQQQQLLANQSNVNRTQKIITANYIIRRST